MCKGKNITKMCCFYVSDVHLVTMLLPYLSNKVEQGKKVYTLLEEDLKPTIEKLLEKITLKKETKERIRNINWDKKIEYKYSEFEQNLDQTLELEKETYFMIMGSKKYIQTNHSNLQRYLEKRKLVNKIKIDIIDCYEAMQPTEEIEDILQKYQIMINTSGEKKIEELFKEKESNKIAE